MSECRCKPKKISTFFHLEDVRELASSFPSVAQERDVIGWDLSPSGASGLASCQTTSAFTVYVDRAKQSKSGGGKKSPVSYSYIKY